MSVKPLRTYTCDVLEKRATRVVRNLMARYTFMAGEFTIDVNAEGGPVPLELLLPQDRCLQFAARHFHGRQGLKAPLSLEILRRYRRRYYRPGYHTTSSRLC